MRLVIKGGKEDTVGGLARWAIDIPAGPGAPPVMIGRDEQCDVALPDDTNVSRHHLVCHAEGGRLHIRDLGSRNGTYLNGAKVVDAVMLAGDEITVGSYRIRLESDAGDAPPPTLVGAAASAPAGTFTTSGTAPGVAAVTGLTGDGESDTGAAAAAEPPARREMGPIGAIALTIVLLGAGAAVVPLVLEWRADSSMTEPPAAGSPADAWRAAMRGETATAAGMVATASDPASAALRDWLHAGGGLPPERPGSSLEVAPLERLLALPAAELGPVVRSGVRSRLARIQREQRASAAARRAIALEADGDVEAAITTFESLGTWPDSGAAKRHRGRAATLRARRCRKFRELGASNRAAGDWDGALRCFRTAARHARGAEIGLVAAELREAERETAVAKALGDARTLAGAGEWRRALAVLEAAPGGSSQTRRLEAMRNELERRLALRDAWAAYAAGESDRARSLVDRWRTAGDPDATALWRRAGAAAQAFADAEAAVRERAWERAWARWRTVLQIEPDDRVVWRRRALQRLEEWPEARVVAELRGDALAALERKAFHAARDFLDRAHAVDPAAVAADLDRLRTRAQLLYNTALNLERTDPAAARPLYADVAAMTRPGESKHAAAQAALERLHK